MTLGISTSLLVNYSLQSLKPSYCFLLSFTFHQLSTPFLGHCICGMALLECVVNSEILLWDVRKRLLSSRTEGETSQLIFLHCIRLSHCNRAQFETVWHFTAPYQIRQQRSDTCRLVFCFLTCVQFEKDLWGAGHSRQVVRHNERKR